GVASTAEIGAGPWQGWAADGRVLVTETREISEAVLVDPRTGEREPVASGPLQWLVDLSDDGRSALLRRGGRDARRLVVLDRATGVETAVDTGVGPGTDDSGMFGGDGVSVLVRSDVGRDRAALVLAAPGEPPRVLAERADAELQAVAGTPGRTSAALLWVVRGGSSALSTIDLTTHQHQAVAEPPRPVLDDLRLDPTGTRLLFTGMSWSDPRGVWSGDLVRESFRYVSSRETPVVHASPGAGPALVLRCDLTQPHEMDFVGRDGTPFSGWLYAPADPGPWPTLLYLHGGPEAQERPVYNSLFQSLVATGVAVCALNVRGSSGFGRVFRTADNLAGRFGAIDDVADCVHHLVEVGCARPEAVGVMGRSYGGYLTLAALVWHPELFAVGVDVCGMADFHTFYRDSEPWIAQAAVTKYGDPVADADLLQELSPIHRIDRVRAPLLVVHGGHDTNVPVGQAQQVVDALRRLGAPHDFLLFPDEGHELAGTTNRVVFVRRVVEWVTGHLDPGDGRPLPVPAATPARSGSDKPREVSRSSTRPRI
uniref:prolyl oligopeptidase family serine peptidase n=1 Tax=Sporichthya sp. TaxID=65475 RepID=UPI00178E5912